MDERRTGEFSESAFGPTGGAELAALGAGLILLGGLAALSRGRAEGVTPPRKRTIFAVILTFVGLAIFVWRRLESLEPAAAESPSADVSADEADRLDEESLLAEAEALAVALQSELAELDEVVAGIAEELEEPNADLGGWRIVARATDITVDQSDDPSRAAFDDQSAASDEARDESVDDGPVDVVGDESEDDGAANPLILVSAPEDTADAEGVVARVGMYSPDLAAEA